MAEEYQKAILWSKDRFEGTDVMEKLQNLITAILERLPAFDSQAVLVALIAGWVTGWLWYLVADGAYRSATKGIDGETRAPRTQIRAAIAQVVMTVMLAVMIEKFGAGTLKEGISIAIMMWFGFVMTTMMVNHSHLGAPLQLTIIDGIHWFLVLVVMGAIIGTLTPAPVEDAAPAAASSPPAVTAPATTPSTDETSEETKTQDAPSEN